MAMTALSRVTIGRSIGEYLTRYILFDFETTGLQAWIDNVLSVSYYDSEVVGVINIVRGEEGHIFNYLFEGPFASVVDPNWKDVELVSFNGLKFDSPFIVFRCLFPNPDTKKIGNVWDLIHRRLSRSHIDMKQFGKLESGRWGNCALEDLVPDYEIPKWDGPAPPWVGKYWTEISKELWEEMAQYQFEEMRALIKYIKSAQTRYPDLNFPFLVVDPDNLTLRVVDLFEESKD